MGVPCMRVGFSLSSSSSLTSLSLSFLFCKMGMMNLSNSGIWVRAKFLVIETLFSDVSTSATLPLFASVPSPAK